MASINMFYSFKEVIEEFKPDALDGLTDDELDYISCFDDYDGFIYTVVGKTVFVSDGMPGDIVNVTSVDKITDEIDYNLSCILEELRGGETS